MSAHEAHGHPDYLQHHFDTPEQQYSSSKLGMWLFLATEILLFGGLFVAYAIYRANHPEVFAYAHTFLNTQLGAINTVVLLCSSLTMAWGVRAAQLGQRRLLLVLLSLTLLGGFGFMGIKTVEYKAKFEHGTLWAKRYKSQMHHEEHGGASAAGAAGGAGAASAATHAEGSGSGVGSGSGSGVVVDGPSSAAAAAATEGFVPERSTLPPPAVGPSGTRIGEGAVEGGHAGPVQEPRLTAIFFSIYFLMTGLHGLHVVIGMGAIGWVLVKSARGAFGPEYYTPVDLVGLYWHLVDLIWIFLFPLLYLIH